MKTAIIYTRVSSDAQVTGTSLESQESDLRDYCDKTGYTVIEHFQDAGESAKTTDRPALIAALDFVRKKKPSAFVVHKLDRLSRNASDGLAIRGALVKHGCELVSISEPSGSDPVGQMIGTVMFAIAEFDNSLRAQRCKRGLVEVVKRGGWCWCPPRGFVLERVDNLPLLKPDGVLSIVIADVMHAMLAGRMTKVEAVASLRSHGVTKQMAYKLFEMPVYGGIIRSSVVSGDVLAAFPGLVTPEEWYQFEARFGKGTKKHTLDNDDFPLATILHCPECGGFLRGGHSTGRTGKKYSYYWCPDGHVSIRAERVNEFLFELLDSSAVLAGVLNISLRHAAQNIVDTMKKQNAVIARLKGRITAADNQIQRLTEGYASGTVQDDAYRAAVARLRLDKGAATAELENTIPPEVQVAKLEAALGELQHISDAYVRLSTPEKKKLLKLLFGSLFLTPDSKRIEPRKDSVFIELSSLSDDKVSNGGGGGNRTPVRDSRSLASTRVFC